MNTVAALEGNFANQSCYKVFVEKEYLRLKVSSTLDLLRFHRLPDLLSLHGLHDWLIFRSIQELLKAFALCMQDSM